MNLILFSVTTFAVLDYFYRFMRFVSTDLAKIAKFLCFYSKSGLWDHLTLLGQVGLFCCLGLVIKKSYRNEQNITDYIKSL